VNPVVAGAPAAAASASLWKIRERRKEHSKVLRIES
jgi:hypothetical protein